MTISLKQVQYFLAAAEAGQFVAAAAQVHVTQTAVTAAIKELEASLGLKLFERHRASGVTLTPDGRKFLVHARSIAAAVDEAIRSPGLIRHEVVGQVSAAATQAAFGAPVAAAVARFMRVYPRIEVKLIELNRRALEDMLGLRQIDCGFVGLSDLTAGLLVNKIPITHAKHRLWLCAHHPLLAKPEISLSDVGKLPYVLYTGEETPNEMAAYWARHRLEPYIRYKVSNIEAVRSLVAEGLAVTILSDAVYRQFSTEGLRIEAKSICNGLPPSDIGLVTLASPKLSPAANAFVDFIKLTFSDAEIRAQKG